MKLLAWDTSSKVGALVALEWDPESRGGWDAVRLVSEWTLNVDATHSESLLWGIHRLLEGAKWKIDEIDLFGAGTGPGSFTGLRIGLTTVRTLAHTLGKPVIGVSSLAALARPAALALAQGVRPPKTVLVASTDAAKGELFTLYGAARSVIDCVSVSEDDRPGLWKRGVEEKVLKPDALLKAMQRKLSEGGGKSFWASLGEGNRRYPEMWKKLPKNRQIDLPLSFSHLIQGRYLGQLVWEAYQAGLTRPALSLHPRYLRPADAELKLRAGLLPPGPSRGHS